MSAPQSNQRSVRSRAALAPRPRWCAVALLAGGLCAGQLMDAPAVAQAQPAPLPPAHVPAPVPPKAMPSGPELQSVPAGEPQAAPDAAATHRPGFLDALGRWFGDPRATVDTQIKSTRETLGNLGSQARDAAGAVVAVPGTRIVTGRQLCPTAANGAPDCQQGVETLCRTKGFQGGRSLDVSSSQRCPARVWISGRSPKEGECRMETYVTRAVCQ